MSQVMLIDYFYCSGCHTCEIACQQEHGLPVDKYGIQIHRIGPDQISETRWQYEYLPAPTLRCDRCVERQAAGKKPLCEQSCQAGCIFIGELEDVLPKAVSDHYVIYS